MNAPLLQVNADTVIAYWWISLAIGVVITLAVGVLLYLLLRTANEIEKGVEEVWRVGKLIANNTVHIALLIRTNQVAGEILHSADGIAAGTARIRRRLIKV